MQLEKTNFRLKPKRTRSIEGFSVKSENNAYEKNIINLVKEIKENEKKNEENNKDKKKKKLYTSNQNQNKYPIIKLTPLNNQTIQYILSCKLRTPNMLTILNAFLSSMKFLSVSNDVEDKEKLLYSLSFFLKMDKKPNGSIIFRYGNKGTRFYIVLGGEVSVLILREKTVQINNLNYLKYLLYLKVIKEDELAKKIITANPKTSFKITEKYLDIYYEAIIAFINKYYIAVPINETEINEKENLGKTIFKYSNQEIKEDEYPKGLYDYNNNLAFESLNNKGNQNNKNFQKFYRHNTFGENKINSILKLKYKNNLIDNEEKDKRSENENSDESNDKSFLEKNQDNIKKKFKKMKSIKQNETSKDISKEKEKSLFIKYKATSKIPNYLELDISTFGPSDCSRLVNFVIKNLENFHSRTNKVSSLEEYINNCYIDDSLTKSDRFDKKEQITIFQYFEITRKKEGDIFGELALQHNDNKRTATMIATKDSVFGYLSKNDYSNCLRSVEMKKRKNEVNFIMSFNLFDENNWVNFEKTYFNYFKKEYLTSGQIIIDQNEIIENIYFIMEGQIEITTNLNFREINLILKQKNKRIKNKKNKNNYNEKEKDENQSKEKIDSIENTNHNEYNMDNKEENNISTHKEYYYKKDKNIDKKKFSFLTKKQIKELNDLKNFRLCVIDNKDILGLNDICSKEGVSFVKATCVSNNVVIFTLKKNILDELKKKNSEIEKNVNIISNKREKIMIQRLKITTNYMFSIVKDNKIKMSEVHKIDENKDIKYKEARTHSAIYTIFSPRINKEYNNTITNYKNNRINKNLFKRSNDKINTENNNDFSTKCIKKFNLKKNLKNNIGLNYNNIIYKKDSNSSNFISKIEKQKTNRNFNIYVDIEKSESNKSLERKTCFQKFMESVTERVSQIQNAVTDAKFTGLFSPVYTRNIRIGNEKPQITNFKYKIKDSKNNKFIIDKYINYRTEDDLSNKKSFIKRNNSISLSQNANNYVLINRPKTRSKGRKKTYKLLKLDGKNDSLAQLFKNQKHIVQHQYTLSSKNLNNQIENQKINIITNETNDPKKIAISEFSKKNKNIFYHTKINKFRKFKHPTLSNFNPIEYMKIILGTRYKKHEVSKGQLKFSKILTHKKDDSNYFSNPEFQKNLYKIINENKNVKFKFNKMVKPTKVDLLVYNKTIENKPEIFYRNFTHEQETKKRLCSRNVKRRTKTICFTRTLTNSEYIKYI